MSLPYELLIGLRYTYSKRRNHFVSFISLFSMLGIMLGVAALITVLSVMNGFQEELRTRILGVISHIQVSGAPGDMAGLDRWQPIAEEMLSHRRVLAAAPYIQAQGMLVRHEKVRGVLIRGVLPEREGTVAELVRHMKVGALSDLHPDVFGMVLGADLARSFNVGPGDKVTLVAPQGSVSLAGVTPRLKAFTVVGIFEVGMYEYDSSLALIHLADAQKLYRTGKAVSGVRLKTDDLFAAPRIAQEIAGTASFGAYIADWTMSHANFFRAVQLEKTMMFIILSLIVAVAAFNLVSTLVMTVTDKEADIAILRTLGARPQGIMLIFMIQGAFIGVTGLLLGIVGGVLLASNMDVVAPALERLLGMQFLAKDVYYISELPSQLVWSDVQIVTLVALILSLLATLYPSWRAARVKPAEALRYE